MPLPLPNTRFPNDEWALAFAQYDSNNAWYSDDPLAIQRIYAHSGNPASGASRGDADWTHYNKGDGTRRRGGIRGMFSSMWHGKVVPNDEHRTRLHAPVASNLATLSADLLTAEPITFRLVDAEGKTMKGKAQDRLDLIGNGAATHRTLSNAAEIVAGIGAVVLTANWDRSNSDAPWLDFVACDAAIPEFIGKRLVAVNLYTMHVDEAAGVINKVYVHIERHEVGLITHALYRASIDVGDWGALGELVPLDTLEATQHLPQIPGSRFGALFGTIELPTGITTLTASWWKNLPTKAFRKNGKLSVIGRADFEGVEELLDAVDEVWSSWMRDIKIARARLIVPESFVDVQGAGMGGAFDDAREILTPLNFVTLKDGETITAQQFEIRYQEHAGTLAALTREITQKAGYSMSTYGDGETATSKTATEVVDRTTLTERTRDKKFLYAEEALAPIMTALMEIDAVHYGGQTIPKTATLKIEITELSQIDPEKEARVFQYLRTAMAASTDTLVRAQHPDWDETQISVEVERIREENNLGSEADPALQGRVDPVTGMPVDASGTKLDENGQPIDPNANPVEPKAA